MVVENLKRNTKNTHHHIQTHTLTQKHLANYTYQMKVVIAGYKF